MKYTAYVWNDFNRYAVGADPIVIKNIVARDDEQVPNHYLLLEDKKEVCFPSTVVIEFHEQKEE